MRRSSVPPASCWPALGAAPVPSAPEPLKPVATRLSSTHSASKPICKKKRFFTIAPICRSSERRDVRLRAVLHSTELGHFSGSAVFKSAGRPCHTEITTTPVPPLWHRGSLPQSSRRSPTTSAAIHHASFDPHVHRLSAVTNAQLSMPVREIVAPLFGVANTVEICGVKERGTSSFRGPTSLHGLQHPPGPAA